MKKSRFSEEQAIGFLKQAEAGIPIKDLCRKGGFSDVRALTGVTVGYRVQLIQIIELD